MIMLVTLLGRHGTRTSVTFVSGRWFDLNQASRLVLPLAIRGRKGLLVIILHVGK